MSLVDGFRQGFGMMSDYYNRKDAKEYRQEQLGLQRRRMNMAEESHNANMETAGLNTQILQNQVNDLPAATKYRNTMRGLQVRGQQLSVDGQETQNEINDFNLSSAKTNQGYKDEDRKNQVAKERFNAYVAAKDMVGFATDPIFKDTNIGPLQNVKGIDAAIKGAEALEKRDFKTAIEQANILFSSKLNRNAGKMEGRDGGTIQNIKIIDVVEQPDGLYKVPVWVTTDGPSGGYNSFLSEQRGIDPDDPDKVFTGEDLFGTVAAAGSLASMMKASGIYDQMLANANRYLAPQGSRGNGIPAKVQEMEYTRRLLGDEQYKQWLMFGRGKSPQELGMAAYKLASDTLEGVYFDSPEEKKAAVDQMTTELVSKFSQPTQSGQGGTPQPNPSPNPNQYSQLIQQATTAIQNGKDRNAVIQRLVEMGVPQDQINL